MSCLDQSFTSLERLTSNSLVCLSKEINKKPDSRRQKPMSEEAITNTAVSSDWRCRTKAAMTLSEVAKNKKALPGEAYLLEEANSSQEVPRPVVIFLHDDGFDLYSYTKDGERVDVFIAYSETLIRCSLNEIPTSEKPYVIQLEAGLRTIFICYPTSDERDGCFTKVLASVGQFLVLNPRSRKTVLGKKTSNPLSPVSPLSLSAWPSTKHFQLSSLLNALDITSDTCLTSNRANSSFSFRFPALLVSLCNTKPRRAQAKKVTTAKTPIARSYTLPFSKQGTISPSCKQFSARNALLNEHYTQSSLEKRAALGILNVDSGDMRQYYARVWWWPSFARSHYVG